MRSALHVAERRPGLVHLLAGALAWRLAYFPIMVFSGHVASIGEWILALLGLPILVFPTFLLAVGAIQAAAGIASMWLVEPPAQWVRWVVAPAFGVAVLVSFTKLSDIRPLPDTVIEIAQPIPALRPEVANPYLPALVGEGYLPNQRVMLLAAGLTYETIPPSPWATAVKAVLSGLFEDKPFGSTRDRVLEHYLAYHSAHALIGCRRAGRLPHRGAVDVRVVVLGATGEIGRRVVRWLRELAPEVELLGVCRGGQTRRSPCARPTYPMHVRSRHSWSARMWR